MPFGRPGDMPLTDILNHGITVYGFATDQAIREINALSTLQETYDWWSQVFSVHEADPEQRYKIAITKLEELRRLKR